MLRPPVRLLRALVSPAHIIAQTATEHKFDGGCLLLAITLLREQSDSPQIQRYRYSVIRPRCLQSSKHSQVDLHRETNFPQAVSLPRTYALRPSKTAFGPETEKSF